MKRMTTLGWCGMSAATVAMGLLVSSAPAASLMESLPEQTLGVFSVRDFTELKQKWEASRYSEAWKSPELEGLRETLTEQWAEFSEMAEEETGIRPDRMLEHFQGHFSAFAMDSGLKEDGTPTGGFGIVAEVPADRQAAVRADVEKLLEKAPADAVKSMETFRGVDIFRIQFTREIDLENPDLDLDVEFSRPFDLQYAFTGDLFLLVEGKNDPMKVVLAAMGADATTTLGRSPGIQSLKSEVTDFGDSTVIINFPRIMSMLTQQPDAAEGLEAVEKLGLRDVGPGLLAFSLTEYGMLQDFAMPTPAQRKGLLAMMAAGEPLQVSTASLAPSDVSSYVAWTLDMKQMWDAMFAMLVEFSPEAQTMVQYGFMTANANFEVDVEQDIIGRIKGEHAIWLKPIPAEDALAMEDDPYDMGPQNPQVVLIGLRDGQQTVDTLNRLFRRLVTDEFGLPLEEAEVRGTTIWSPSEDIAGEMPVKAALGLSPSALIFATSMEEMQDALRRVGGESAGESMATNAEFQELLAGVPKDWLRIIGYNSTNVYRDLDAQIDSAYMVFQMMAEGGLPFQRDDIPTSEWFRKYFGPSIQGVYVKPEMIRIHQKSHTAK